MMTAEEALYLLGLKGEVDRARVQVAYDAKRTELAERLANAPTDGLRAKYQAALGELVQAYESLSVSRATSQAMAGLSHTQVRDLPGAAPSHTQYGSVATNMEELAAGTVLADRYEIRRVLGHGGMGAVYEAFDRLKRENIAIKVLLPQLLGSEKARDRFLNEAKIACRLAHPHIVRVFDVGASGGHYFMTMELLEGQTLRQRIEAQKLGRTGFEVSTVIDYARQLIAALEYAHEHLVHRDLKPENVWIDDSGRLKLMDFGIARALSTTELTKTGMAMGTAYYMAPEQLSGAKEIDGRADQYSLGVISYELLTGQIPQGAVQSPKQLRREIPSALSAAVMKAMAPRSQDRHQTVKEFARSLERSRSLMSSPAVKWGAAAAVVVSVIGALLATGVLNSAWDAMRPVSKAERQGQQLDAIRLQAQVQEDLKIMEESHKQLQAQLKSAQDPRSGNPDEAQRLTATLADAERWVFGADDRTNIRTELVVVQELIRQQEYAQSIDRFDTLRRTVLDKKQLLLNIEQFHRASAEVKSARAQYAAARARGANSAIGEADRIDALEREMQAGYDVDKYAEAVTGTLANLRRLYEQELASLALQQAAPKSRGPAQPRDPSIPGAVAAAFPDDKVRATPLRGVFEVVGSKGNAAYAAASGKYVVGGRMWLAKGELELKPGEPWPAAALASSNAPRLDAAGILRALNLKDVEIRSSVFEGLYEVAKDTDIIYVSADARFYWHGDLYDVSSKQNLTERRRKELTRALLASAAQMDAITFEAANPTATITVFTDPQCGFCQKLHTEIAEINALGISVRYLPYPRAGVDTEAARMLESVWCASDRKTAYTRTWAREQIQPATCGYRERIAASATLGNRLGVRGTPTIYLQTGEMIGGYMPAQQLAKSVRESRP